MPWAIRYDRAHDPCPGQDASRVLSRLARDTLIYGGSYLAGRLVNFILLPVLAAVLVPQDFGAVDLTLALASFALVTVALEVAQGLARSYPEATSDEERARFAGSAIAFG